MSPLMIAAVVAGAVLMIGAAGAIYRIVRGPSLLDRAIATDVLLVVLSAALILEMAVNRHTNNIVLVLLAAMVGFVGSVTIARFVEDNRPDMQPPTEGGSRTAAGSHTEEAARG